MAAYKEFLLVVFEEVAGVHGRTLLCSQAVLDKVTSMLGWKKAFRKYVNDHPDTFFSIPKSERSKYGCIRSKLDEIETSCHPEFLLNKLYYNSHTENHALRWDYMYTMIHIYLDESSTSDPCTIGSNIIKESGVSFELLKLTERERNERNSVRQKEKMRMGTHNFQNHARKMLYAWGIPIPEGADVLSLYQSIVQKQKMEDGKHNFQVYAANMLAMMGVEVPDGGNVLIIYQKELIALGVHPWQVYAREQLTKINIHIPEGANVLSMYRSIINKQKMKKGEHALQQYAADMLRLMGEKIDDDDDVLSMYQKALCDLGLHNFQNLSEDQIDMRDINTRLGKMANALPGWKTEFDKLCKWPTSAKRPTRRSCKWLWNQKEPGTRGIQSKADFEASHSTEEWRNQWNSKKQADITGTEWQDNHAKLKKLMKDKKWKIEV